MHTFQNFKYKLIPFWNDFFMKLEATLVNDVVFFFFKKNISLSF